MSVKELRNKGYKVFVTHYRRYIDEYGDIRLGTRYDIEDSGGFYNGVSVYSASILPTGGQTRVLVETPEGRWIEKIVKCSDKDMYSRKIGRSIGIGRALKELGIS